MADVGWLSNITAWFANVFQSIANLYKTVIPWILGKVYLLFFPFLAALKSLYDFWCSSQDFIMGKIGALSKNFDADFAGLPDTIAFVNFFFPIDTLFQVVAAVFLLWIACIVVSQYQRIVDQIASAL